MSAVFAKVLGMSISASFLIIAVIIMRFLLKRFPKWIMELLWAVVALRLLVPFQIESRFGILPDYGSVIESYFDAMDTDNAENAVTDTTYHNYEPYMESDTVPDINSLDFAPEERDYLPNEEIIVMPDDSSNINKTADTGRMITVMVSVWMTGIIVAISYSVYGSLALRHRTKESVPMAGNERVYICDNIDAPFILGIIRPRIILPSSLNDEITRNVISHENAHIRRKDHLKKLTGFLILAVNWFNPFVWLSYVLFSRDIELACDEKVIRDMSMDERKSYAEALLSCGMYRRIELAYPLGFGEVGVKERVKSVLNYKRSSRTLACVAAAFSMIVVCFLVINAQTSEPEVMLYEVFPATEANDIKLEKHKRENALREMLMKYDYETGEEPIAVSVTLEDDGSKIVSANVFILSKDSKISTEVQEHVRNLIAGNLKLGEESISLVCETYNSEPDGSLKLSSITSYPKVTMNAVDVTPTGCTLTIYGSGGSGILEIGERYTIERFVKSNGTGRWVNEVAQMVMSWEDMAYLIDPELGIQIELDWESVYGTLSTGHYRVNKQFTDYRAPGDYDQYEIYAEFDITEKMVNRDD